jgi:choline dehydrogenase-like flavoprotein
LKKCKVVKRPAIASYLAAIEKLGIPNGDINGPVTLSTTMGQLNIKDGKRVSAFSAYLEPFLMRSNLYIWTNTMAEKILFDKEKRAFGVRIKRDGEVSSRVVRAKREIILSAGVINSPQLLMLSGN